MKTIILNIFSRILKLCRCVFLLDVYLFYVLMYVLQEIFPPWHIPFNETLLHACTTKVAGDHAFMKLHVHMSECLHACL